MQAVRRWAGTYLGSDPGHDPGGDLGGAAGAVVDAAIAIAGAGLTAAAAWDAGGLFSTRAAGPPWLLVLVPLLLGAALTLRRRAPLLMWTGMWAGIVLQDLIARHPPRNPEFLFVLFPGSYWLGAHASLRRGAAGLVAAAPVMALVSLVGGGTGLTGIPLLGFWLIGVLARSRRRSASLAGRNAALQRQAEQAAAAERARIARELHDIVAHHLSVIVLQAAGARASGRPAGATLEKIEDTGRQALAETRRLLGVLHEAGPEHDTGPAAGLAPRPSIGDLAALAGTVRAAGLPVRLDIDGDPAALPAAVDLSVYRIVQEALTNVLRHAGPARAEVTIGCADDAVTIEVTDDGTRAPGHQLAAGGHGLAGMRERAAVFGGDLQAGPRPGGGFAVRARLPLGDPLPPRKPQPTGDRRS